MLANHIDLANVSVESHQARLLEEAKAARHGGGMVRKAIGSGLVRLGELIGGTPAPQVRATPRPLAVQ